MVWLHMPCGNRVRTVAVPPVVAASGSADAATKMADHSIHVDSVVEAACAFVREQAAQLRGLPLSCTHLFLQGINTHIMRTRSTQQHG